MHARELVLNTRRDKDLSYKELCRRLEGHGVRMSEQTLINKLNRGLYSFGFALLMLHVMGVASVKVPKLEPPKRRA